MYDPKCRELAEYFLREVAATTSDRSAEATELLVSWQTDLAQTIQDAIEGWRPPSENDLKTVEDILAFGSDSG